jgi:hypothetical protein
MNTEQPTPPARKRGRKPRPISEDGYLRCTKCDQIKHISEFYQHAGVHVLIKEKGPNIGERIDVAYGKPQSWCKECMSAHNRHKRTEEILADELLQSGAAPTGIDDLTAQPWWDNPDFGVPTT